MLDTPQVQAYLPFRGKRAFKNPIPAAELTLGTGAYLVNALAVLLSLLIPGVLYGVYRLGGGQIELAQERSNFVSAVSHELKTPLTSIRMYGEILRAGWVESEDKKRSYYDFIFFESERLSRLSPMCCIWRDSPITIRRSSSDRIHPIAYSISSARR